MKPSVRFRLRMQKYIILLFFFLVFIKGVYLQPLSVANTEENISPNVQQWIDNGGYAVTKDGTYVAVHNLHNTYVPASIIKIATTLAALEILGPAFRFETSFFLDTRDNLYIKGMGDPFLISEEVGAIIRKLKELGCKRINNIYLDNTAFDIKTTADGGGSSENPYDAQNTALAVNFNTVNVEKSKAGNVTSAEEQTPTLPLMAELAEKVTPGIHRINISWKDTAGGDSAISQYAGELFRAFQKSENVHGDGKIELRKAPDILRPFYIHQSSKTLEDIIGPLMLYSNNFIANQIFLAVGAVKHGYPATWEKGRMAVAGYLHGNFNLTGSEMKIIEGSGLSRRNRISPHAMIQLLDSFRPHSHLLPRENGMLLKSGTLNKVYSYAGYFVGSERMDSFVLMLNQGRNTRNKVLLELKQTYHKN